MANKIKRVMKELSIEEKAKRYDEALKEAVIAHKDEDRHLKATLERIFPELKENWKEEVRKWLIEMVEEVRKANPTNAEHNGMCSEAIAWLEKQGEHANFRNKIQIGDKVTRNEAGVLVNISQLSRIAKPRKQGEQKPVINMKTPEESLGVDSDTYNKIVDECVYGEQKPTDKVEPKFNLKVGQWIVATGKCVYLITKIDGFNVTLVDTNGYEYVFDASSLDDVHEWTITDAKDGDVLACNEEVLLFKSYSVQGRISLYCWYNGQTNNFHSKEMNDTLLTKRNKICPATKEQRDTLMKAMADAGYTFDFEKKELKKIEQEPAEEYNIIGIGSKNAQGKLGEMIKNLKPVNEVLEQKPADKVEPRFKVGQTIKKEGFNLEFSIVKIEDGFYYNDMGDNFPFTDQDNWELVEQKSTWSEEDENRINRLIAYFEDKESFSAEDDIVYANWLKSLKERVQPQPKQEWSDVDKDILFRTINDLKFLRDNVSIDPKYAVNIIDVEREITWLKSLKDRYTWKPSEEQIQALSWALSLAKNCGEECAFDLRTLQDQLKKLKE